MKKARVLLKVRQELKKYVEVKYREGERNFFKEKIKNYGVRMANRRKVAKAVYEQIKDFDKDKILEISEEMLKSGFNEEATVAFSWVYKIKDKYEKGDFEVFERWVKKYVDNWAKCDDFCTHTLGYLIYNNPELTVKLTKWTSSENRWVRRASAVSLIHPFGKKKKYLSTIFKVAKKLLADKDDMVQKGYGWMLKEASKHNQEQVFEFVMKNKDKMPRTALRYAIEKMPEKLRKKAMER